MATIERTEGGRLRVSSRHRSTVVDSEGQARATLYQWGHTDLAINMALARLRETRGESTGASGWRISRPGDPAPAAPPKPVNEESAVPAPENAAPRTRKGVIT